MINDLVAYAVSNECRSKRLKNSILQAKDTASIRSDLAVAFDFVTTAEHIFENAQNSEVEEASENCSLSLLYSSIILYARATKTSSNSRRTFDFISQLDGNEIVIHGEICKLRDDAVAHFGPGEIQQGLCWHKEGVFLANNGDGLVVMTASSRLVLSRQLLAKLKMQINRLLILSDRMAQSKNLALVNLINKMTEEDPEIVNAMSKFWIDPVDFFGTQNAVNVALSGHRVGARRGSATISQSPATRPPLRQATSG